MTTPADLTAKQLWLRAKDLGAAGSNVSVWADQSGQGNDGLAQDTAPVVVAGATPSGGKAVQFSSNGYFKFRGLDAVSGQNLAGGEGIDKLFDGSTSSKWLTGQNKAWVIFKSSAAIAPASYTITSGNDAPSRDPKAWTLYGHNDATGVWEAVDSRSNEAWTGRGQSRTFQISGTKTYSRWKWDITQNSGDVAIQVAEFSFPGVTCALDAVTASEVWVVVKPTLPTGNGNGSVNKLWNFSGAKITDSFDSLSSFPDSKTTAIIENYGRPVDQRQGVTAPYPILDGWHLYRVTTDASGWRVWLNGSLIFSGPPSPISFTGDMVLGESSASGSFVRFKGQVAELLIRHAVSADTEAASLTNYFNAEHGISASVPAALPGKVMWFRAKNFSGPFSASGLASASEGPEMAFDGNASTQWTSALTAGPHWLVAKADAPAILTQYAIKVRSAWNGRDPKAWRLEGSSDGLTWTVLDTQSNQVFTPGGTNIYSVSGAAAWRYYRLFITATAAGAEAHVTELMLTGPSVSTLVNWPDVSGNGLVATPSFAAPSAAKDASLKSVDSVRFDAGRQLQLPSNPFTGKAAGEVWVVVKSDGDNNGTWGRFGPDGSDSHYTWAGQMFDDFGRSFRAQFTPSILPVSEWRLIRIKSDGTWTCWIDGVQQFSAAAAVAWRSSAPLIGSGGNNGLRGNIAEIYGRSVVSSPTQARDLARYFNSEHGLQVAMYALEVLADAPLGHWRLTETSGATAANAAGTALGAATLVGGYIRNSPSLLWKDPDPATALAGGYADVPYTGALAVQSVTLEAIAKPSGAGTMQILDRDDDATRVFQFRILPDGSLQFLFWTSSGGPYSATSAPGLVSAGQVVHAAATYDRTTGKAFLYANGAQVAALTVPAAPLVAGTIGLRFGAHQNITTDAKFQGVLDELAFYDRALPAARIKAHYDASVAPVPPPDPSQGTATGEGRIRFSSGSRLAPTLPITGKGSLRLSSGSILYTFRVMASGSLRVKGGSQLSTFYVPPGSKGSIRIKSGSQLNTFRTTAKGSLRVRAGAQLATFHITGKGSLRLKAGSNVSPLRTTGKGSIRVRSGAAYSPLHTSGGGSLRLRSGGRALPVVTVTGYGQLQIRGGGDAYEPGMAQGGGALVITSGSMAEAAAILAAGGHLMVRAGSVAAMRDGLEAAARLQISSGPFAAREGSLWLPYPITAPGSRALDFAYVPTSPEVVEPWVVDGDVDSRSLWFEVSPATAQTLVFTPDLTFSYGVEVWSDGPTPDPAELTLIGYAVDGPVEVAIAGGQRVLVRVHPLAAAETGVGSVSWTLADRAESGTLQLECSATLEQAGWLWANVASAAPLAQLDFTLDGLPTVVHSDAADELGIFSGAVYIPDGTTVGAHTLTVTDLITGQSATTSFEILTVAEIPAPLPVDLGPATPAVPDPVIKWVFEDRASGGLGSYTFPINPSSMSSPEFARTLTPDHAMAPGGQAITWEGVAEPASWQVEGSVETRAHYEALEAFYGIQRRFYAIDHLQRAWVVSFESLEFTKKDSLNDWAHSYTAKFLIVDGPKKLS